MADHAALISERLEQLLSETDEHTDVRTFRGKQYDLGLGWVHFPEGYGFEAPPATSFGVGVHRLAREPAPFQPGRRLFSFVGNDHPEAQEGAR